MPPTTKAQVVIEERLRDKIKAICSSAKGSCGLIVGQLDGQRFLVSHLVRATKTPVEEKEKPTDDDISFFIISQKPQPDSASGSDEEVFGDPPVWRFARERFFCPVAEAKDISNAKLTPLAVEVQRLLPGGLNVLGIFFTSATEVPKTARPRLKELMSEISAALKKDCPNLFLNSESDEKVLLAFEPRSCSIVTSLSMDAADCKAIIKPIPVIFQQLEWLELRTRFRVDLEKPTDLKNRHVEGLLQKVLSSYGDLVRKSIPLIGGQLLDSERPLPVSREGVITVAFLTPLESMSPDEGFNELIEATRLKQSGRMAFNADVVGRAVLHGKSSVGFAVQALKDDLLRSMNTRMDLHCEDILVTDTDEQEFDVVHELARRILAPLGTDGITFSNYLHETEPVRDSLEVFVGLLDMEDTLTTAALLTAIEQTPNQREVDSALESVSTHSGEIEMDSAYEESTSTGPGTLASKLDGPVARSPLQTSAIVLALIFGITFALYQVYLMNCGPPLTQVPSKEL
ncbi:putative Protein odr-4-like protein [Hypsibius exemplaris]|uniref:Protein odr-4-like protein n=1 Tax=Hypsibius exemplaris TaxID=2072580 RepID=A0A1W0WJW4_HYPEX|nr:putative Protein odr-4-like protein [Hypsibius exemplaris]